MPPRKDHYYNKSKQEGYRARSAYKLKQLDETAHLFDRGDAVVDLGAAPGGWLQVAAEKVGPGGTVVGVDLQRIDELEHDNVETIRGDMTETRTKLRLRRALGEGLGKADDSDDLRRAANDDDFELEPLRAVDVVISDMAPNMSGEYSLDHARSVHLARQAFEVSLDLLAPGGDLVVKVFDGKDLQDLRDDIEEEFQYVRTVHPEASRDESSELYLVGKGYTTAPVAVGDELEVEIVDVGGEGDGIAKVDDYTIFVPEAEVSDIVSIRIDDVKPRFGFGERR